MYVIDLRTPGGPQGQVPPEDIVGAFEVKDGALCPDSYQANENHEIYSEDGLVRLPPSLQDALLTTMKSLLRPGGNS